MNYYILDADGYPVAEPDIIKWARWFEDSDKRRLALTELEGGVIVSTVFLGLDHQYGRGLPLLREIMIFGGEHDGYCDRYSSREEALRGHEAAVVLCKEALNR